MLPNMDGRSAIGPFDVRVSSSPSDIFNSDSVRAKLGGRLVCTKYATEPGVARFVYDVLNYGSTLGGKFPF